MKFCKYSAGDFVMRHKIIDKSLPSFKHQLYHRFWRYCIV